MVSFLTLALSCTLTAALGFAIGMRYAFRKMEPHLIPKEQLERLRRAASGC